ncbi:ABC transporter permease [Haliovirga abyssi]|uniref:ABC transporter permease n=1 Tax=Haliovirga abyssi TaxID=2996794 RepID=A0AAU9DI65_9FUSO|nr:ABC transporter permease [Haliovirga abyssi]BDU51262.1 hypothetical protein HLVA_18310 [Haliovirga abyssi]
MNLNKVVLIFKKDFKELLRDKKALIAMFLPIIIYPIILIFIFELQSTVSNKLKSEKSRIIIKNEIPSLFLKKINLSDKFKILNSEDSNYKKLIKNEKIDMEIEFTNTNKNSPEKIKILYNSTITKSKLAKKRIDKLFDEYKVELEKNKIKELNIKVPILDAVQLKSNDLSKSKDYTEMILGSLLPFLLTIYSIMGIYAISIDLTAGEKERGTLETIFSIPVKKSEIIFGKLLASSSVGIISCFINILAVIPLLMGIMIAIPKFSFQIDIFRMVIMFFMLIPIIILSSSIIIGVGFFANSYKEAQSYLSPVLLILMLPCYVAIFPNFKLTLCTAMIPISGGIISMRNMLIGNYNILNLLIANITNIIVSIISIIFMTYIFKSEKVIFGTGGKNNFSTKTRRSQSYTKKKTKDRR